jgi:hypothetical protein
MIIKFSHLYNKMPRDFQYSKLLQVLPVKLEELSSDFLHYDTSYLDGGEEKQYVLPAKGAYMILMLQAGSGNGRLWTTIRSQWPPGKLEYYKLHIGEVIECKVTS